MERGEGAEVDSIPFGEDEFLLEIRIEAIAPFPLYIIIALRHNI